MAITTTPIHCKAAWPDAIKSFLIAAAREIERDCRVRGLLLHGSYATERWDACSDVDLTCVCSSDAYSDVVAGRTELAERLGDLHLSRSVPLSGNDKVLFCLYGPDLLRVEIVFKRLGAITGYTERPWVLWERFKGEISGEVEATTYEWPEIHSSDIEGRFWLCIEQATRRLQRGELLEVLEILGILRHRFLGPMLLRRARLPANGLRRLEVSLPTHAAELAAMTALPHARGCRDALVRAIDLYEDLRADNPPEIAYDSISLILRRRLQAYEPTSR